MAWAEYTARGHRLTAADRMITYQVLVSETCAAVHPGRTGVGAKARVLAAHRTDLSAMCVS
jgi:hypothetical protein